MTSMVIADARASWRTWVGVGLVFVAIQASTVLLSLILVSAWRFRASATGAEIDQATSLADGAVSFGLFLAIAVVAVTGSSVQLAVNQRRGALARWALAGATPRQLVVTVMVQILLVSFLAAIVGAGAALAGLDMVLDYVADEAGIGPARVPPVYSAAAVGWGVAVGGVLAVVGGWRQARSISQIGPVEALRQAQTPNPGMTVTRWILTGVLVALITTAFVVMPQATGVDDVASLSFVVVLLAALVVAAASPALLPGFTALWTALLPGISAPWFLARRSIVARLPRLAGVVVPLALAVALFVGLQTVSGTLAASVIATTEATPGNQGAQTADLVITLGLPLLVAIAGAVGGLVMSGQQRDADLAVAGVAGATPTQRLTQAVLEAFILAVTGVVLGALAAAIGLASTTIGLDNVLGTVQVDYPWRPLITIAAVTCVTAVLVTVAPALKALRQPPHQVVAERIAE